MKRHPTATETSSATPLPGLRPGVVLVGEGESAELRDMRLGQVVRLGTVAAAVVALLDGTRHAERLLVDASRILGEELNPLGLVELLRALDRRALLDTPRARMVVAQGLVRADIAALQRLTRRVRIIRPYEAAETDTMPAVDMAPGSQFACQSCARCCTNRRLLGPVSIEERDRILDGFTDLGDDAGNDPSNFVPLATGGPSPVFLLRARKGRCSYLDDENQCRVQAVLGLDAKPSVCRAFPFHGVRTPTGWDVGMSLYCPTVAQGKGGDPLAEATETIGALRVLSTELVRAPDEVPLSENADVPWAEYRAWERQALDLIADPGRTPSEAWMEAIECFLDVVEESEEPADIGLGTLELPDPELIETEAPKTSKSDFVPAAGVGSQRFASTDGMDVLLRDLALWSELLTGLEAADPEALRRLHSGLLRLRFDLGVSPEAAPVLSELVRLRERAAEVEASRAELLDNGGDESERTHPSLPNVNRWSVNGTDEGVQRRFLSQALIEKRAFAFGTVARGLLHITVMLGLLKLESQPGDELQPRVSDIAYLIQHPQLTDIADTRATVRMHSEERSAYRVLLGLA